MSIRKILIADSDENIISLLRNEFASIGFATISVKTGGELIDAISRERLDGVVLEMFLPEKHGLELIPLIKAQCGDIPIIAVTSRDSLELERKAREMGVRSYFVKPIEIEQLVEMIRSIIKP